MDMKKFKEGNDRLTCRPLIFNEKNLPSENHKIVRKDAKYPSHKKEYSSNHKRWKLLKEEAEGSQKDCRCHEDKRYQRTGNSQVAHF